MTDSLEVALQERSDLDQYGDNKRLLFALQLSFEIEDIATVAATSLTDGPNDKSCDLLYIDRDSGKVVLAQGYESGNFDKPHAPTGKAADLNQAVNWLLSPNDPVGAPASLRAAWRELHDAISEDSIKEIEIWYVHNLPESTSVDNELRKARDAAKTHLESAYSAVEVFVSCIELGRGNLSERYRNSKTTIAVADTFTIQVPGAFEEYGDKWTALCTSVDATWLRQVFRTHGRQLFSPNVRDYLGSRKIEANINNGIQDTVRDEPSNMWAYNNGLTALVHSFENRGTEVLITGLGIVNGAQTTGAIGSVEDFPVTAKSNVLIRFIQCNDPATVASIVRYNNRQNPTQASDFRSNDAVQRRLVQQFRELGVVGYNGGRRGGAEDVIRRPGENQLPADVAAQALAAFHGNSGVAYHEKGQIWEQDALYSSVFPPKLSARHVIFVTSSLRAIEAHKSKLGKISPADRTGDDTELHDWFSLRGSIMLAQEAIGSVTETVIGSAVSDPYALQFKNKGLTIPGAVKIWEPLVESLLAFAPSQLQEVLATSSLRKRAETEKALRNFRSQVSAARRPLREVFEAFSNHVQL